ncbi:ABC transporter permease [Streptomyces spinosirectus]|uniref:ABC transporter permease n=1 Tax=Streptomyces TaxID=1883 RepID=UPI0019D46D82|nr:MULTISPECIES: ABC transporter permease [Streptomyces]MBY8338546.1 ABC transporter permease [Streptomyces plumbidurans]UIR16426.1 ABC transporter permease [Streptomyces spinosirectus]
MSRSLVVLRLVVADVRRHPAQALLLLLSLTVSTAVLALGCSLSRATDALYENTRAATAGPDLVAVVNGDGTAPSALRSLRNAPGVVAHSRTYQRYSTTLTTQGSSVRTVAQSADARPGPIDRPLVTSGRWVRPGGVVVERGFAAALGIRVGDRVGVAGRALPVVGIAVTAASPIYPWATMSGPGSGPTDHSGLVWLDEADTRPLVSAHVPTTSLLYLKLRNPDAAQAFADSHRDPAAPVNFFTWQRIAEHDALMLRGLQTILVMGSWMLGFVAVAGVATLAAGRAAAQTRRMGLLKAVGATPGLVATVLFAEYLTLALIADALGLTAATLTSGALTNPGAGLISTSTAPTGTVAVITTVFALATATLTTLAPTLRALRTATVKALADPARTPRHRPRSTAVSAVLPTSLLLGVRLVARRPGRAFLHACGTATTQTGITFLLLVYADRTQGYDLGATTLTDLRMVHGRHVLLALTVVMAVLALVNTVTITWTTALEARPTMAVARTFGATPAQITAGLSLAQLLPALLGVLGGMPLLLLLPLVSDQPSYPPAWLLLSAALAPLLATVALTAVPARLAARRSVTEALGVGTV